MKIAAFLLNCPNLLMTRTTFLMLPQAIVHDYWTQAGILPSPNSPLTRLDRQGQVWLAETRGGVMETFDAVVSTLPVPQLLGTLPRPEGAIGGNFLELLERDSEMWSNLQGVRFNSVFCLGVFFDSNITDTLGINWKAKYFPHDPVIRYVAIDNAKRGFPNDPTVLTVQSQVSFGQDNLGQTKQEMEGAMLEALQRLLPSLPTPSSLHPHKWRYSQTSSPFPGSPGAALLHATPPLLGAGDSFSHSNFDGCLASAQAARDLLRDILQV